MPQANAYASEIRNSVEQALEREGDWQLLELPCNDLGTPPVADGLETVDGIIAWVDQRHQWLGEIAKTGVPVVNCGADWLGVPGIGIVAIAFGSVIAMVLEHFRSLSLVKMVYAEHEIAGSPKRQSLMARIAAAADGFGIASASLNIPGASVSEDLRRLLNPAAEVTLGKLLGELPLPCGVFCGNDHVARLICNVAQRIGLRVPADLAVIGAGDDLISRYGTPSLSTVRFPGQALGKKAFHLLLELHAGREVPDLERLAATQLIVRESTGGKQRDIAMERVHRHIEREALGGLTVEELKIVAGISLKALRKRYRLAHGQEPSAHIREIRMGAARDLLARGDSPVTTIAGHCGFSSLASFSNYFLRHQGVGPAEYRRQKKRQP